MSNVITILNPFTGENHGTRTELHFDTGEVWHVHPTTIDGAKETRELSSCSMEYWLRTLQKLGIDLDAHIDEGL